MFTLSDFRKGMRVQLHPATDSWMRGDRFGTVVHAPSVTKTSHNRGKHVQVLMDRSNKTLRLRPEDISEIIEA